MLFMSLKIKFLYGQMNGLISIYNNKKKFLFYNIIIEHCEPITSLSELNDNTILISSADGTLRKIRLLIKFIILIKIKNCI